MRPLKVQVLRVRAIGNRSSLTETNSHSNQLNFLLDWGDLFLLHPRRAIKPLWRNITSRFSTNFQENAQLLIKKLPDIPIKENQKVKAQRKKNKTIDMNPQMIQILRLTSTVFKTTEIISREWWQGEELDLQEQANRKPRTEKFNKWNQELNKWI